MCLIAWNWQPHSDTPLLLLGNRDEYYDRPAAPLHWWEGAQVLAGRDLQAGGTWLGVSPRGRLAALTNYRAGVADTRVRPSRGELTTRFLQGEEDAHTYLHRLAKVADQYNPFNLLLWDGRALLGLESRQKTVRALEPGIHAVSNADFDTPWPKLQRLKHGLEQQCTSGKTAVADLLPLLQDTQLAAPDALPDTGISRELERMLSAAFIASPRYGTRASSIICVNRQQSYFFEQRYDENGPGTASLQAFNLPFADTGPSP